MFEEIIGITIHGPNGDVSETDPVKAAELFGQLDPLTHDGRATGWLKREDGTYTALMLQGGCYCSVEVTGTLISVPPVPECVDFCDHNYN